VHRDVKPSNLLRIGGLWKISDLGTLRAMTSHSISRTQVLLGSTLALVLLRALTGQYGFSGSSQASLQTAICNKDPLIPPHLPEPLNAVIRAGLTKDPHQRLTADRVVDAIEAKRRKMRPPDPRLRRDTQAVTSRPGQPVGETSPVWTRDPNLLQTKPALSQSSGGKPFQQGPSDNPRLPHPDRTVKIVPSTGGPLLKLSTSHLIGRRRWWKWAGAAAATGGLGWMGWDYVSEPKLAPIRERITAANVGRLRSVLTLTPDKEGSGGLWRPQFSVDNRFVAITDDRQIYVWKLPAGNLFRKWKARSAQAHCAFTPYGFVVLEASRISCYDLETGGTVYQRVFGAGDAYLDSAISPDGKRVAVRARADSSPLYLLDGTSGELVAALESPKNGRAWKLTFSHDAKLLAAYEDFNATHVALRNAANGQLVTSIYTSGQIDSLAFQAGGDLLATVSQSPRNSQEIEIWNRVTGTKLSSVGFDDDRKSPFVLSRRVAFSSDFRLLATCLSGGQTAQVRELETGTLLHSLTQPPAANAQFWYLEFSPDSDLLINSPGDVASDRKRRMIQFWDVSGGTIARADDTPEGFTMAFSPDETMIVNASQEGALRVRAII
jgi:WD40 repeat protein